MSNEPHQPASPPSLGVLSYHTPTASPRDRFVRISAIITISIGLAATYLGYPIMLYDVESVLVLGPILALTGTVGFMLAFIARAWPWTFIMASQVGICILFFLCVNILKWGPSDARQPFAVMGVIYLLLLTSALILIAIVSHLRRSQS